MEHAIRFDRCELRPDRRELIVDGAPVAIGARAFDVLMTLVTRRESVVTKDQLLESVWPGLVVEENNLQVQISALRKLLGARAIATIPGRGYRFTAAVAGGEETPSAATDAASRTTSASAAHRDPHESSSEPAGRGPVELARHASAGAASSALRGNLPDALPQLYGRDHDVDTLCELLGTHRLVSVVGAGGIGKTRLAVAAAHRLRGRWRDGAWLVELAACTDPALVPAFIAQALSTRLPGAAPIAEEVVAVLRGREMLLVLDNCEHLLERCASIAAALLADAPGVRVLATSQEPLNLPDEQQLRLAPLAVPASGAAPDARTAGAIALFEARARNADPRFELSAANLDAAVDICRRLDGIALAIELAAARVPLLGVEGLRARLDDRFRVLTAGSRLSLRRHQTLRATVEWSFGLLSPDEQATLRRLGAFTGSFGLEAAQAVAAGEALDEWEVLDHLGALVSKSLVVAEAGAEPRYRLLETTRAFAVEKLDAAGETSSTLARHAAATRALFERSFAERWSLTTDVRIERYEPDLDNLRAALDWSRDSGDRETLVALVGASGWLWDYISRPEGLERCAQAAAAVDASTPPLLEAHLASAHVTLALPSVVGAVLASATRAVDLYRAVGTRQDLFSALCLLSRVHALRRESDASVRCWQEAEGLVDAGWPAALRMGLPIAKLFATGLAGRDEDSTRYAKAAHRLANEAGDPFLITTSLMYLEQNAAVFGDFERAVDLGYEIRARKRAARFARMQGMTVCNLAAALIELDRLDEAMPIAREAVPLMRQEGNLAISLDPLALLAAKQGRLRDAARTVGCVDARYAAAGYARQPNEARERAMTMALVERGLSPDEIGRCAGEGAALTDDEAVRVALDGL